MFANSISGNKWYHGKTPKLQINILKQIITSGKVSKTLATKLLGANYPDISNSIDALAKLEFIKISGKKLTTGRNYEIFYKITEKGLQGLMEIKLDKYEFWKVIILLCMISNRPLDEQELEYYFNKYEHGILSHHSAFSLTHLFDNIIYNLMNSYGKHKAIPPSQKVLECLALNGPSNINKLSKKTCMTEEEINRIMGNILVRRKIPTENSNDDSLLKHTTHSTNNNKKKINSLYSDQVLQALILENETKDGEIYELTLLGIMTVLAIITYHFAGMDDIRFPAGISSVSGKRPRLFYSSINPRKYFDAIALNYRNKIPLIF